MSDWHAPPHGAKWTKADYIQAEIRGIEDKIDFWNGKKSTADYYIQQNENKIGKLREKLK